MTLRIRAFVDYWNFQLSLNEKDAKALGQPDSRFQIDWKGLGAWLAKKASETIGAHTHTYEGVIIYTSFNPKTDGKFRNWAENWLDRQPGIAVALRERRPKGPPKCPVCHERIYDCPKCSQKMQGTVEKGVDTLIATDMIRLAWEKAYDAAVIASSDADLVPAVEFLNQRGIKVIQAGFPPLGVDLATACWGSFDVFPVRDEIRRT